MARRLPSLGQLDLWDGAVPEALRDVAMPTAQIPPAAPEAPAEPAPRRAPIDLARPRGVRVGGRRKG